MGSRRGRRWAPAGGALGLAVGLAVPVWAAAPSTAVAPGEERTPRYDVTLTLRADGSMRVREAIRYDFGFPSVRHGIERFVRVEAPFDGQRTRTYPVDEVAASSPTGAPAGVDVEDDEGSDGNDVVRMRIGDPDETVSGVHDYVLEYDVRGVVDTTATGQELNWTAVGPRWAVAIERATVRVQGPAGVSRAACFEGIPGSSGPCAAQVDGAVATFTADGVSAGEGVTVVAGFPAGTFPGAAPLLEEIWSLDRAFARDAVPVAGGLAGGLGLSLGALGLLWRRSRDERSELGRPGSEVRVTPPDGMRPGQVGTLIDEHAQVADVTATLVDLAVRGFLVIEELPAPEPAVGEQGAPVVARDWRLVKAAPAASGGQGQELLPYETALLGALFEGRNAVRLSEVRESFATKLAAVRAMMHRDVAERGWFHGDPASVRTRWLGGGIAVLLVGVVLTVVLAATTRWALLGVGLVVGGVVLVAVSRRMPARTAAGARALAQARSFRHYLETAEVEHALPERGEEFSRHLPYAIAFGLAPRWAARFEGLAARGASPVAPSWYAGGAGWYGVGTSMGAFTSSTSDALAAPAPPPVAAGSVGGGYSVGGGGGGGGGGSW